PNTIFAQLMIMRADGSGVRPLLARAMQYGSGFGADGPFTNQLAWSPDGRKLALTVRDTGQVAALEVVNADGSGRHTVVRDCEGTASPSRATVIRCRSSLLHSQCVLHGFGQNTPTCVTGLELFSPAWSPDGRTIAFSAGTGPSSNLI